MPDNELGIGHETWRYLSEEEDYFDPDTLTIFFSGVREFYKAVASTILNKFTFNDHVFDDIAFLLPDNNYCCSVTNATVQRLARLFPVAVSPALHDVLEDEVLDYRLSPNSKFPDIEKGKPGMHCVRIGRPLVI